MSVEASPNLHNPYLQQQHPRGRARGQRCGEPKKGPETGGRHPDLCCRGCRRLGGQSDDAYKADLLGMLRGRILVRDIGGERFCSAGSVRPMVVCQSSCLCNGLGREDGTGRHKSLCAMQKKLNISVEHAASDPAGGGFADCRSGGVGAVTVPSLAVKASRGISLQRIRRGITSDGKDYQTIAGGLPCASFHALGGRRMVHQSIWRQIHQ